MMKAPGAGAGAGAEQREGAGTGAGGTVSIETSAKETTWATRTCTWNETLIA